MWRFCCVFREDDKVTKYFRKNIREPLRNEPQAVMATIAFRTFNTIGVGEVLKPFLLADEWDFGKIRSALLEYRAAGNPIVTGAYIVRTPHGMDKLTGALWIVEQAKRREPQFLQYLREVPRELRSLEGFWTLLQAFPHIGQFTGYEIVSDLRHCAILENATDVMSWANPGPGCAEGFGALLHGNIELYNRSSLRDRQVLMQIMQSFLEASRLNEYWPSEWPRWEMREVEHWACEWNKYNKGLQGLRLKRRYKYETFT
jgi:hypothetical protein